MPSTSQNLPNIPSSSQQPSSTTFDIPQQPSNNDSNFILPVLPDPPKDPEPKHPGGFIPYHPDPSAAASNFYTPEPVSTSPRTSEEILKAQKYCKFATSALNYEDINTAIEFLEKSLRLLQTGQDS